MTTVEIVSFGYGHGTPPDAHITIDLRTHFRDPHVQPGLRYLTARDDEVVNAVLQTSGIGVLVDAIVMQVIAYLAGPVSSPITVAVGCVGGRHRSAVVAAQAARRLAECRVPARVQHRDIDLPVISRPVREAAS